MSRLPRFFVPGIPLHVIQRGNNRSAVFGSPADMRFFQACLLEAARVNGVAIHAYVLMTNHVHLLATPSGAASMPSMMQSIGRIYVQYFNKSHDRTGTLWEGRYKAAIVEDDRYLFTCMRYIELNPTRAALVAMPGQYRWSSFRANALGLRDALVVPHALYLSLGACEETRQAAYRQLFEATISEADLISIRDSTQHAWALGTAAFADRVAELGRRPKRLPRGRRPRSRGDASAIRV